MKTLSELGLTRQEAEQFIWRNVCGECSGKLLLTFRYVKGAQGVEHFIRCGNDVNHNTMAKIKTAKENMEEKKAKT